MIYCLTGDLLYSDVVNCTAVIDCGGVGYSLTGTASAIAKLPPPCEDGGVRVRMFTYMNVNSNDNSIDLYGFESEEELAMFRRLIDVQGVGPKAALAILSILTPAKLASAIIAGDQKAISKAPGIGAKTAARIILELKDKIAKLYAVSATDNSDGGEALPAAEIDTDAMRDAADALLVLGYSQSEVRQVLSKVGNTGGTENIIRAALAMLMR